MSLRPDTKREIARKILHMAMGLFALCLRWLTPWQAALCALAALLHNLYIFPHYGMKKLERPEEKARGYSGMVGYPAVVLVLILLSWKPFYGPGAGVFSDTGFWNRSNLAPAAGAWAILAFGDAFGALFGMFLGGPRLPWNRGKTWAGLLGFLIVGGATSYFMVGWVSLGDSSWRGPWFLFICFLAAVVAGIVETLPGQMDDNLTVPLAAWFVLSFAGSAWVRTGLHSWSYFASEAFAALPVTGGVLLLAGLLVGNIILATVAFWRKWVDFYGFVLGAVFGSVILCTLGWRGYALLLLFYLTANGSTYYGKHVKESRGIGEAHGGERRTESVFSKGFLPTVYSLFSPPAFAAALAVYAADTVASEFGKTSRRKTFSLLQRKAVSAGYVGGVSGKGTAAGILTVLAFVSASALLLVPWERWAAAAGTPLSWGGLWIRALYWPLSIGFSATLWFFLESVINEWNEKRRFFSKVVIHVMVGGFAGASIELPRNLYTLVRQGFDFLQR
jgi:uncharacterized protein (TIGR00297 family)